MNWIVFKIVVIKSGALQQLIKADSRYVYQVYFDDNHGIENMNHFANQTFHGERRDFLKG